MKHIPFRRANTPLEYAKDLPIIPFNDKNAFGKLIFFSRFQLNARGYLRIWTLVATLLANGQMFERSLRGGNLVQNLETF